MMNGTGGGAYANKEVNEKSQAGSCFVRERMNPTFINWKKPKHQKGKNGYSPNKIQFKKGEGNYHSQKYQ